VGVGGAAPRGEGDGGVAESRGSPEGRRLRGPAEEATATTVRGRKRKQTRGERRLGEARAHHEDVGVVGVVGGEPRRPESSPERGSRRGESATVSSVQGAPGRFLAHG
jgi:hypothetical protein